MVNESEEKIDFDAEVKADSDAMTELGMSDLESNWLRHPKVGEEVILDIVKAYKDKNINARTKEGKTFKTNLSGVDYKITLELKDGKMYSPGAWEVWGKIRQYMREKKTMQIKVKVKHTRDGKAATDKKPNYEVTLI